MRSESGSGSHGGNGGLREEGVISWLIRVLDIVKRQNRKSHYVTNAILMTMTTSNKDKDKSPSKLRANPPSYSQSSSLSSSPVSPLGFHSQGQHLYGKHEDPLVDWAPPGTNPRDVYDSSLPWWRAAVRRKLVVRVQWESGVIA